MESLPLFFRLEGRAVILVGQGEAAAAKRTLLERAGAHIVGEEAQAALAIVATDDDSEALAAIARLKARGVLVNATDRPHQCDFTIPAIIDRDPVIVAIGTGGASAGLAKALRQRLEQILPQRLGGLAKALREARQAMRDRWPEARARRQALDLALDPGGVLDPLAETSPRAVAAWLAAPADAAFEGLHVLEIASDDPDQLTLAGARLLGRADTLLYGAGIAPEILARGRADAVRLAGPAPPDPLPPGLTVQLVRIRR